MTDEVFTIFVYGTLRKGESNHAYLKNAKRIAEQSWVNGELHDTGEGYPVLKLSQLGNVYGEVYEVNEKELALVDELEDYQLNRIENLYDRVEETIHTDNGPVRALLYVAGKEVANRQQLIKQGDWKEYMMIRTSRPIYYFAYGSCMDGERFKLAGVSGDFETIIGKGILREYTLRFTLPTDDGGKADIVEEGGIVEGIVYSIHENALQYLYKREGVLHQLYRPAFVTVQLENRQELEVLTFVVSNKQSETAPSDTYANEIIRGGEKLLSKQYMRDVAAHIHALNQ